MCSRPSRHLPRAALLAVLLLTVAACSNAAPASDDAAGTRVTLTYEGGLLVVDGEDLEVIADLPAEEFTRVNPAGDGRHVMVTTSEGFEVLDTGAGTGEAPTMTDLVFPAEAAGHVVSHHGLTVLYDDATSDTTTFRTADLAGATDVPETDVVPGVDAHHGVSIVLADGTLLTTVGDADGRTGIRALGPDGEVLAESDECPGVHGEGTAADEVVVFGCEDGVLVHADGDITKLSVDGDYGRIGNAYTSEDSRLVVGDYRDDPDAEGYLLDAVSLIDTEAMTLEVVDLPDGVSYTWRDVARGPGGDAFILGSDGALHRLDPRSGEVTDSWPVIAPWESPTEWQDPHPALKVHGDIAWVTEPAADAIHAVDLRTGEVRATGELPATPNEIAIATG